MAAEIVTKPLRLTSRICSNLLVWVVALLIAPSVLAMVDTSAKNQKTPQIETIEFKDCDGCPPMVQVIDHRVTVPPIAIARHELTWAEYLPSVTQAGCPLPTIEGASYPKDLSVLADAYPVTYLPRNEFDCFINWLNAKTGQTYRLPTGEEWEIFARAGSQSAYPWGDAFVFGQAAIYTWFDWQAVPRGAFVPNDPRRRIGKNLRFFPVESFAPNAFGLYDVLGNVTEFVAEQRDGAAICLERFDAARCRVTVARGGAFSSIRARQGGNGPVLDTNFFEHEAAWTSRLPQSPGFRIVRELAAHEEP